MRKPLLSDLMAEFRPGTCRLKSPHAARRFMCCYTAGALNSHRTNATVDRLQSSLFLQGKRRSRKRDKFWESHDSYRTDFLTSQKRTNKMPASRPSKSAITNAVSAVTASGLRPIAVHVSADGSFRIDLASGEPQSPESEASNEIETPIEWDDVA